MSSKYWDSLKSFARGDSELSVLNIKMPRIKLYGQEKKEESLENALEKSREARIWFATFYRSFGIVLGVALVAMLIYVVLDMPDFGREAVPTNNEVYKKYVEEINNTGAINTVSGMILDYRAFDTLGESAVLFTAASAVIILLRGGTEKGVKRAGKAPSKDPVLRTAAAFVIPFIIVFGVAIVINGHLTPGGGFSGGAVIGAALILFANVFGADAVDRFFNKRIYTIITSGSLLAYACLKCFSFYTGANHIETNIPQGNPGDILSAGFILPLNIFVGLIVSCTMLAFYLLFTKGDL